MVVTGAAYDALRSQNFSVIIGPACSQVCAYVGRLAAFLDLPCFTGVCQGVEMSNKNEFRVRQLDIS